MKKANAGSSRPDHLRQCFLRDFRNQCFGLSRLAEFGHQKKNSRQTLFTGIEKLIDKVSLGSHTAG
jgi:hypothetical protein